MIQAAELPVAAAPAPAGLVVVSRETRSDVVIGKDTPLLLVKAAKTENALLRQAIFLTSTLTVLRPAEGQGGDIQRWTYQPHLMRQICFTSITGQFSCAAGVSEDLMDESSGEAPAPPELGPDAPSIESSAEAARLTLATRLSARAAGLFDEDRRLKIDPMFKAAGVTVRSATSPPTAPAPKR